MGAIFITATGTDVGKTFVTAGLVREFRRGGRAVNAIKPVVSGFDMARAATSDPGILLAALGRPVTAEEIARVSPWRFAAPLSPDLAASKEGRALDFDALVAFSRDAASRRSDTLLIEGVGGIMVPLDTSRTVLDWMAALRFPLIVVAGSYLGTISHTLSALNVLARRGLAVAALVVSESAGGPVPLDDTVATIARFAGAIEVIALPRLAAGAPAHPAFGRLAALVS